MILLDLHLQEYSNSYNTQNDCFPPSRFLYFSCLKQRYVILQILTITNHTRILRANECLTFYTTTSTHTVYGIRHHDDIILQVWAPTHIMLETSNDNCNRWRQYMAARWSVQMTFSHDRRIDDTPRRRNIMY